MSTKKRKFIPAVAAFALVGAAAIGSSALGYSGQDEAEISAIAIPVGTWAHTGR